MSNANKKKIICRRTYVLVFQSLRDLTIRGLIRYKVQNIGNFLLQCFNGSEGQYLVTH